MKKLVAFMARMTFVFLLISLLGMTASAETYNFNLKTSVSNNKESATVTATDLKGNVKWVYRSGSYSATELSKFKLMCNDGYVYLVENGSIKQLDFWTGAVNWTNDDFGGAPAENAYDFSSSGKLYISGYYGPDLFVVDRDGNTICRVNKLSDSSYYWPYSLWFYNGDYMRIAYESNHYLVTFNVLDYFGRID